MSVVIGHVSGIMVSDSACESEDTTFTVDDKLLKLGGYLIGMVGDNRPCSRIYRALKEDYSMNGWSGVRDINRVITSVTEPGDTNFTVLVVVDPKKHESGMSVYPDPGIWLIDGNDSLMQVHADYHAIGSGAMVALGALDAFLNHASPRLAMGHLLRLTVDIVVKYVQSVRTPMRLMTV